MIYSSEGRATIAGVHLSFSWRVNSANNCSVSIIPAGLSSAQAGESFRFQAIVLSSDEADSRETPGVRDLGQSDLCLTAPTAGEGVEGGVPSRALCLAVDGGTVCFGFPRRADYPHEAVSELL